jgi:hypothetical protein
MKKSIIYLDFIACVAFLTIYGCRKLKERDGILGSSTSNTNYPSNGPSYSSISNV